MKKLLLILLVCVSADIKAAPVDVSVSDEQLYGLRVTVCVKGECDVYIVDKNFTLEDCKKEAKVRHLDFSPITQWECIPLDVE